MNEKSMMFQKVIVVGGTNLVERCFPILRRQYEGCICFYDVDQGETGRIKQICSQYDVEWERLAKEQIMDRLMRQQEKTLVFSIMCPYLFGEDVVHNKQITILNLHHGLLPGPRGRNATAWAIYEQDPYVGISWCLVDEGVDTGGVICQKRREASEDLTAIRLLRIQNALAIEALEEQIADWLMDKIQPLPKEEGRDRLHRSWEIPNKGVLNLSWDKDKQSAFLRAMDYGIQQTLGQSKVEWEGKLYMIKRYKIFPAVLNNESATCLEEVIFENDQLQIKKSGGRIQLQLAPLEFEAKV